MSYVDHILNKNKNGGYALVTALLFFLAGSAAVVSSLSDNILRETRMVKEEASSKQSYMTSEAALEDVLYRIKKGASINTIETMVLGSSTASVTTETLPDGSKEITSEAISGTTYRSTESTLSQGSGINFKYAVQSGVGGVELQAGIDVEGDIYTAGTLKGGNATIHGNATAAEVASTTLDQSHVVAFGLSTSTIYFGNSDSVQDAAQSFVSGSNFSLQSVDVYIGKIGNPANITVKITADNHGKPNYYNPLASGTISSALLVGSLQQWVNVTLTSNPTLVSGQKYWIVLDGTSNSSSYFVLKTRNGYANGDLYVGRGDWGSWTRSQPTSGVYVDMQFRTYVGNALVGVIGQDQYNKMTVTGDAYGNQVSYVNATGNVYCQTGINNNKSCNTSRPNPTIENLTIPPETIDGWKTEAQQGGTVTGNTTIGQPPGQTIGPKKIVGNLVLNAGTTAGINGPVWVTGNLSINGGAKLYPVNNTKNYVIVVDGTVSIGGGASIVSLNTGKILIISTNSSDVAVSLDGGANDTALAAPYGGVSVSGGATINVVSARKIYIGGGSNVVYSPELSQFTVTPSASGSEMKIKSWKEVE